MQQDKWQGKSSGGVLGYKIFVFILKTFGLNFAYFFLGFISFFYFLFSKSKKDVYRYFREIHQYSRLKSIASIYKNYYVFGQTLLDKFALLSGLKTNFSVQKDGQENLIKIHNQKQGGLLISAHMGNWEIAGQLLNIYDVKFNMLVYDNEAEQMKKYMDSILVEKRINLIGIRDNDISYLVELHRVFGRQEWLIMHGDRFREGAPFIEKMFLGKKAKFPAGPFILAAKFGVPVLFSFCFKENNKTYQFYAKPGIQLKRSRNEEETQAAIKLLSDAYIKTLEEMVKKYPLQWFNFYDFWED
ncbi:MAG: lipid A biosynthesis acyltransferase [Bacteroidia bacterium]